VGNYCLWCKDKPFNSVEAVRAHMTDLSHCKLLFDDNEEEYADFYDYGEGEWVVEGGEEAQEWEEVDESEAAELDVKGEVPEAEEGNEDERTVRLAQRPFQPPLALPSSEQAMEVEIGDKLIGHRAHRKIYKQRPKPIDHKDDAIRALIADYQSQGVLTQMRGPGGQLILGQRVSGAHPAPQRGKDTRREQRKSVKVSVQGNKLFTCYTPMNTLS